MTSKLWLFAVLAAIAVDVIVGLAYSSVLTERADGMTDRAKARQLYRWANLVSSSGTGAMFAFIATPHSPAAFDWPRLLEISPIHALMGSGVVLAMACVWLAAQPAAQRSAWQFGAGAAYGLCTLALIWLIPAELVALNAPWWVFALTSFIGFTALFAANDADKQAKREVQRASAHSGLAS